MLTKAILTGVVLSAITGSIVYFGTEGADAKFSETRQLAFAQGTELAGAPDEVAEQNAVAEKVEEVAAEDVEEKMTEHVAAVQDPISKDAKPKTKWLDQYLKRLKPETKPDADAAVEAEVETEAEPEIEVEVEVDSHPEAVQDEMTKPHADGKRRKRIRIKKHVKDSHSRATATGTYVVTKEVETEAGDPNSEDSDDIDLSENSGEIDVDALDLDGDIDVQVLKKQLGLDDEEHVDVRVIKRAKKGPKGAKRHMKKTKHAKPHMAPGPMLIEYDMVLEEAKKLIVTDMRNQAVLEIIDYAIDNRDMSEAADLVEELSTPELRDTARARIGAGLARCGKPEAAFAVIDELEIDELAAPIRLEIITALMATQKERKAAGIRR